MIHVLRYSHLPQQAMLIQDCTLHGKELWHYWRKPGYNIIIMCHDMASASTAWSDVSFCCVVGVIVCSVVL